MKKLERKFGLWRNYTPDEDTADRIFRQWAGDVIEREMRGLRDRILKSSEESE